MADRQTFAKNRYSAARGSNIYLICTTRQSNHAGFVFQHVRRLGAKRPDVTVDDGRAISVDPDISLRCAKTTTRQSGCLQLSVVHSFSGEIGGEGGI